MSTQQTQKVPHAAKALRGRPKLRFPEFSGEWEETELRKFPDKLPQDIPSEN